MNETATADSNRVWAAEHGVACAECGHANPVSMAPRCACCARGQALIQDRDDCTECTPMGTFPDGSGYPCAKHAPA